jgi:hypothetical protein
MSNESLETIHELTTVVGGMYDAKKCVDSMIAWGGPAALGGAFVGPWTAVGAGTAAAGSAYLDSVNCGPDGVHTPMNQIHDWYDNLKPPTDMPEPQWSQMTA